MVFDLEQGLSGLSLAGVASALVALTAIGHALIYKRDPRSATLWLLVIGLLPLVGTLFYVLFGINRYQRKARRRRDTTPAAVALPPDEAQVPEPLRGLAALSRRVTGLPLTGGNRVEVLVGGAHAYPEMLTAIRQARHSLALMSYIFEGVGIGAEFVRALIDAHRRGVRVRVLIDDVYVRLSPRSAFRALKQAGVPVAAFNATLVPARLHAVNLRNHRKILVVDGCVGFTGGMNIYAPYWRPDAPGEAYRDLHFRLEGPVVGQLRETFAGDWCDTVDEVLDAGFWGEEPRPVAGAGALARGIEAGPDETLDRIRWVYMGALAAARHSVRIWTPYFVPDQAVLAAISTAALRGVEIDLLVPAQGDHALVQWASQAHHWQVLEHGARIHAREGPFDHSKLLLVDDAWACIGSANWDARSLRLNFEFNVEIYDATLGRELANLFEAARAQAVEITPDVVGTRPLPVRLRDGAARLLTPIL